MKLEEATGLLQRVCSEYRGTLNEHQLLQQALQVVIDAGKKKTEKKK